MEEKKGGEKCHYYWPLMSLPVDRLNTGPTGMPTACAHRVLDSSILCMRNVDPPCRPLTLFEPTLLDSSRVPGGGRSAHPSIIAIG